MKLKILLIIFFSLIFFQKAIFAQDEIKRALDEYRLKKEICQRINCEGLEGREAINCLSESRKCLEELQNELALWSEKKLDEIQGKLQELQKEKETLQNQIIYLKTLTEKTEIEINLTQERISFLNFEISKKEKEIAKIKDEIKKKENEILRLKENLAKLIRTLYEYEGLSIFEITFFKASLSDFFNEIFFFENLQRNIARNLNNLKIQKEKSEAQKKILEEQMENLEKSREEVSSKIVYLNKQIEELEKLKKEKVILLEITKGDEGEYQRLLEKVKAQKEELLSELAVLSRARQAEIEALVEAYGGRAEGGLFGRFYYFSQDFGPWSDLYINNLPLPLGGTMRQYGCAITSAAMVLKHFGIDVNPGILAQDSRLFDGILIKFWNLSLYGINCLSGCTAADDGNINWEVVDSYLNQGKPVILMIKTNDRKTHFVVAIGKIKEKYMVFDPIYAVSQGKAVDLNVSIQNILALPGVLSATVTRMIIFSK